MDRQAEAGKLAFVVLACNLALAIRKSWGDTGSVAFVLAADAALVLLFLCLRRFERARGGGTINMHMGGQYSALAKLGLAVLTCNTAIDTRDARRDPVSAAFVFVSYAVLVILMANFVRAFAHAHAGEPGQDRLGRRAREQPTGVVADASRPWRARVVWPMAVATATAGFWAFFLKT